MVRTVARPRTVPRFTFHVTTAVVGRSVACPGLPGLAVGQKAVPHFSFHVTTAGVTVWPTTNQPSQPVQLWQAFFAFFSFHVSRYETRFRTVARRSEQESFKCQVSSFKWPRTPPSSGDWKPETENSVVFLRAGIDAGFWCWDSGQPTASTASRDRHRGRRPNDQRPTTLLLTLLLLSKTPAPFPLRRAGRRQAVADCQLPAS